jgi:hypothetical protein
MTGARGTDTAPVLSPARDDLIARSSADFAWACTGLAEARRHQQEKDTPTARSAVAEWRAMVDLVMDLFLEASRCDS